jgi:hypothetical protein
MGGTMGHCVLYVCLGIAYLEAAFESFGERKRHCACREIVIACLYVTGVLITLAAHPASGELPL